MKRSRIINALMAVCITLSLTACGSIQPKETDDILLKIAEANTRDALKKSNNKIAFLLNFTGHDGKPETFFTYQDQNTYIYNYIYDQVEYSTVDKEGNVTYFYGDEQQYLSAIFIGETAYEEDKEQWSVSWFTYDPLEKIIDIKESNGQLIIDTELTDPASLDQTADDYGCEADKIKKVVMHYEVDAENYEINQISSVLHFKDGTSAQQMQLSQVVNYEDYMPTNDSTSDISDLEKRTITLIENPGTKEEQSYHYSVPKGYDYVAVFSTEYDNCIYKDAEFTQKLKQNTTDLTKDVTGYIRKAH